VQIILPGTTDYIGACTNRKIINHTAIGRAQFLIYPWFIFFYVGDQTQTSIRPNCVRDFESCNLRCLSTKRKMLQILVALKCVKYIFQFYRSVRFKVNFKYTKNRWNILTLQLSLSLLANKIVLICKFFSPEPMVVNLF